MEPRNHNHFTTSKPHKLTNRETYLLSLVATGRTDKEIADELCISDQMLKTAFDTIFSKINASDRFQAMSWATENLKHLVE